MQPQLDGTNRLSQRRLYPERGELLGEDGDAIVEDRPVFRIGIDKSKVSGDKAKASAIRLAKVVKINAKTYAEKVAAAGNERIRSSHRAPNGCAGSTTRLEDPCDPGCALHPNQPDAGADPRFCPTDHRDRR